MARLRWIFLRFLGLIYLIAFASLYPQIPGLIGERGIQPAAEFLRLVHERTGARGYTLVPSLAWLQPADAFLQAIAVAGVVFAGLAIAGIATGFCFLLCWALYLSLVSVGGPFMAFQWDALLLETGFLTIFFAPWPLGREKPAPPPVVMLWLMRWLAFRLVFLSGVVKLASGDPAWRDLSALQYHYQTQPLPNAISWFAHQLPGPVHKASCAAMFGIELLVPFVIFVPWRLARTAAAALLIAFQLAILATGNYTFFNWLTIALCLLILGDYVPRPMVWRREAQGLTLALTLIPLSLAQSAARFRVDLPVWVRRPVERVAPFQLSSSYGLFAVMTVRRPEIIVEGSLDGEEWQAYEFRHKPGDPRRAPTWAAPHQPRLDWQMWFAALSGPQGTPWFHRFVIRLLEGSPGVLRLMRSDPFPGRPPKYVRARLFEYRFTTPQEKAATGDWWRATPRGIYFPAVSLKAPPAAAD
jgi:hypothetical protein